MHTAKASFFGILILLTAQFPLSQAARHQEVVAQQVSAFPIKVPLLQRRQVATQHGSWGHIRTLVSTHTAITTLASITRPTSSNASPPKAKILLSAKGPNSDCGTHIQPLCPLEEEPPPGDGLLDRTLEPEVSNLMKVHVHKNWAKDPQYTFMVKPDTTCHEIKLRVLAAGDWKVENRGGKLIQIEMEKRQKREREDPEDKYKALNGLMQSTILYSGMVCEDVHTMEYYHVPNEGRLDLIISEAEEAPDGSGLKAGQGPETEPPCITRPPCAKFGCHDVDSVKKSRSSNLHAPSICLLIPAILTFFTSLW